MGDMEKEAELLRAQTCFAIDLMKDGGGKTHDAKMVWNRTKVGRKVMAKIKADFQQMQTNKSEAVFFLDGL